MTKRVREHQKKVLLGHLQALDGLRGRMVADGGHNVGLPRVEARIVEIKAELKEL